jgi:hypothetical protein
LGNFFENDNKVNQLKSALSTDSMHTTWQ